MIIGGIEISHQTPFALIAGPCQIENLDHARMMAERLSAMAHKHDVPLIYKSSFDKANRTSVSSMRGVGMEAGLEILLAVKKEFALPIITDVHAPEQCEAVAEVADILQIPAFLCRQTDLLVKAGEQGKAVMVKKGQFLSPEDMKFVGEKIKSTGNEQVLFCERGSSFGYNHLINDFRGLEIMAGFGAPVIFDATHSTQSLGGASGQSGGARQYASLLARAALAVGVAGLFVEVHQDPNNAPSDGPAMIDLEMLDQELPRWKAIDAILKA